MNQVKSFLLTPGYISGLVQTDGSFFCTITLSSKHRFGMQFRPQFTITADLNSKFVLESIQNYFGCGKLNINVKNFTAEYRVTKLKNLQEVIIPHFKNYPVFCAKLHAFFLFSNIVSTLFNKEKRTVEGRIELLKMALSMNATTNRKEDRKDLLFSLLHVFESKDKELINNKITSINTILSNDTISDIIDGDGSFYISFNSDGSIKPGFSITNDIFSRPLLESIQERLKGIGTIYKGSKNELRYIVTSLNDIIKILIPFVNENPIFSERASHFEKFKFVSFKIRDEKPLSLKSKLEIVVLAYNANKEGKHRRIIKSDYIKLLEKIHS